MTAKILVSSCLAGIPCCYDGEDRLVEEVRELVRAGKAVKACPEVLGGLLSPRPKHELVGGGGAEVLKGEAKVISEKGADESASFKAGAEALMEMAKEAGVTIAILKARSPSCGAGKIYNGTFMGVTKDGDGVAAALLRENGIKLFTEEELEEARSLFPSGG